MAYQEDEKVKLKRRGTKEAIALAMQGKWQDAVDANKAILASFPDDVDAYNRLGRAYLELGDYAQSREAYNRAIGLDPYNAIAKKNLDKLSHLREEKAPVVAVSHTVEPQQFIEETGKAGVVGLRSLAAPEVLAKIVAGDVTNLRVDGTNLIVEDVQGEYLGQVDPKYGHRLAKLIIGGNKYTAAVVSATESSVSVILREVYQDPQQAGVISFPARGVEHARVQVSDRMLRRELDYGEEGEEEPGFTIIGEEEELLPEDTMDDKSGSEE
jgi:hypothetical protein